MLWSAIHHLRIILHSVVKTGQDRGRFIARSGGRPGVLNLRPSALAVINSHDDACIADTAFGRGNLGDPLAAAACIVATLRTK